MTALLAALGYLFVGRVFVFIARDGAARTRVGQLAVALGWPVLVAVMFGFIAMEMVQTRGGGYPDDGDEGDA